MMRALRLSRLRAARAALWLLTGGLVLGCSDPQAGPTATLQPRFAAGGNDGFGFNGTVSGFPTGAVFLTGGGAYNLESGFVKSGGGFRCTEAVAQGPLAGCAAGEGVRWDTVELLASTTFKCTGSDTAKTAITDDDTVVLLADFYRAGDGIDESFTAQIIVSARDIAPDLGGRQTLWVQGVGCDRAITNFN